MSTLTYTSTRKGTTLVVKIGGSLDLDAAPKLNRKLGEEIDGGARHIVLNLAGVDYMASAGLGAIVSNSKKVAKAGGEIRLSCMSEKITRMLTLLGFIDFFKSYDTDDDAVKSF